MRMLARDSLTGALLHLFMSSISVIHAQHPGYTNFTKHLYELEKAGEFDKALYYLNFQRENYRDNYFEISKEEIYIHEKLLMTEENLALFKAGHVKGYFCFKHPYILALNSVRANKYFETVVRIQNDKNHLVIIKWPYSLVRHTAYLGTILRSVSAPFIVGSFMGYIPSTIAISTIITRTYFEDNYFKKNLKITRSILLIASIVYFHSSSNSTIITMKLTSILLLFLLTGCLSQNQSSGFYGFWEGPHPGDSTRRFYIQIENEHDTLTTKGYWTENNFYLAQFDVENLSIIDDSLSFKIPGWKCTYRGHLVKNGLINGGFHCQGEPFDSVILVKNEKIVDYLVFPKQECKKPDFQYKYVVPVCLNDQIETSSFHSTNDSVFIYSLVNEIINGAYGRLNSFLLYKNNLLICEEYFYGYSKQNLHQIESSTKSLTSLLIGIAKDKKLITNLNEPLFEIFPEYLHLKTLEYKDITVNHLLCMTSGFDPQNDALFQSDNRIPFALKRKMMDKPGATFRYDGGNTEILGAILQKKTGMFADDFAIKYLFEPLHIDRYNWEIDKQNGFPSTSGSLHLLPRDMLKIGVMVSNNGSFNKRQIVSEQWIRESTAVKTKTHIPGDNYSYQWWNLNLESNGNTYPTIWANGWGSQFIYIFPEINVVIITTGHNYEFDSWAITTGIRKYLYLLDSK